MKSFAFLIKTNWLSAPLFLAFLSSLACSTPPSGPPDPSQTSIDALAIDETHISLQFQIETELDPVSAENLQNYEIQNFLVDPSVNLDILGAEVEENTVILTTSPQEALATYTVRVSNLLDKQGNVVVEEITANVVGVGKVPRNQVTFQVDSRLHVPLQTPSLLLTVNPDTGVFSDQLRSIPLLDNDQDGIFEATLDIAIDPRRTVDPLDDHLGPDRKAYAALVHSNSLPASELYFFEVISNETTLEDITLTTPLLGGGTNEICTNDLDDDKDGLIDCQDKDCLKDPVCEVIIEEPLVDPPDDPNPGDGVAIVRVAVDDRPARVLRNPAIRVSVDLQGFFDPNIEQIVPLSDPDGDRIFTADINIRPDPNRVIGGNTLSNFPFVTFLRENNEDFESITKAFTVPDETPKVVNLRVGNPALVPVTFRVDVSQAFLNPEGTQKGVLPGESVFLTGEFSIAEDAFGQNAADAFSGGENIVLEMTERQDIPGIWERTIFLGPNRPFGWKVVRCPSNEGCATLNQFVASSGRAFATVMKNLVTENIDLSAVNTSSVLIDPNNLAQVVYQDDTVHNYTNAQVFDGLRNDPIPPSPNESIMFKQEVPDLVVIVEEEPVKTPIFVVGTWRDVNLPFTLEEIIQNGQTVNLTDFDYDDGFIGFFPPVRPDDIFLSQKFVPMESMIMEIL